jgi:hypothetical protein
MMGLHAPVFFRTMMAESQNISSRALDAAELRSERMRIFCVLGLLGVVAVVLTVRVFLLHTTR